MKTFLTLLMFFILANVSAFPCSIFSYTDGNNIFFCNNEDWIFKDPVLGTHPATKNSYGYITFGWGAYYPGYPQGGVNSEGLCYDWAMIPKQKYHSDPKLPELHGDLGLAILQQCKSVDEAIALIKKYNYPHFAEEHLFLMDRKGKSCVVEYNEGKLKILTPEKKYLLATNFHISNSSLGGYPCTRFDKIDTRLKSLKGKAGLPELRDALSEGHQEGEYPTIYSYIVDLKNMKLHVYWNHVYSSSKEYDIKSILAKKTVIKIGS
jgi:hypothetical protein